MDQHSRGNGNGHQRSTRAANPPAAARGNGNGRGSSPDDNEIATAPGAVNGRANGNGSQPVHYDCAKCPAYCCSYEKITVDRRDLARLARRFGIDPECAQERFTKIVDGEQVLRHQKDDIYGSVCIFLDKEERRCTVYESRPGVCHEYPDRPRCGYYDFLRWERRHQDDHEFVPLRRG